MVRLGSLVAAGRVEGIGPPARFRCLPMRWESSRPYVESDPRTLDVGIGLSDSSSPFDLAYVVSRSYP